ncbi:MAG: NFACT RNA binding domain-containing protein [Nanoarchaeota archaeon]
MKEGKNKFRKFTTRKNILALAGRDAASNEELISQVGKEELVFHTEAPGSPFVNLKGEPKKGDVEEAAIFCAKYSRDWKKNKKDVVVHIFKGKDIYKDKGMSLGTFGVKKLKVIKVKKEEIEKWEQ